MERVKRFRETHPDNRKIKCRKKRRRCHACRRRFTPTSNNQKYCKRCVLRDKKIKDAVRRREYLDRTLGRPLVRLFWWDERAILRYCAKKDGTWAEWIAQGRPAKGYRGSNPENLLPEELAEERAWQRKYGYSKPRPPRRNREEREEIEEGEPTEAEKRRLLEEEDARMEEWKQTCEKCGKRYLPRFIKQKLCKECGGENEALYK